MTNTFADMKEQLISELANPDSSCRCRVSETASQIMSQIKGIDGRDTPGHQPVDGSRPTTIGITHEISHERQSVVRPLNADPWVVSSVLQKAVRRGETEMAQTAVLTLLGMMGAAMWSRLVMIACEDIGAGAADLVAETGASCNRSRDGRSRILGLG